MILYHIRREARNFALLLLLPLVHHLVTLNNALQKTDAQLQQNFKTY
jgi:hypothetical protein